MSLILARYKSDHFYTAAVMFTVSANAPKKFIFAHSE